MKVVKVSIVGAILAAMILPVVGQNAADPVKDESPAAAPAPVPVAAPAVKPGMKVTLPLIVYANGGEEGEPVFVPSGWMGATDAIESDDSWTENPHSGESCIKCVFSDPKGWGGIVWQNPANNWGEDDGGVDLTGAKKLSFWVRGDRGGEVVEIKAGLISKNKPFWDTAKISFGKIKLTKAWKQYEMPLQGRDMSRIITGFCWTAKGLPEPVTFYLDDIIYE